MKAKSIKGNSGEEIAMALEQAMADGFQPALAIVFISIKQDRAFVIQLLSAKGIDVFGATSCGEFTDGSQTEGGMVILLLDIPKEAYALEFENITPGMTWEAGQYLAKKVMETFRNPSLILCSTGMSTSGELFDGENLVKGLNEELGNRHAFFGGMAGDDMSFTGSYVFTHESGTNWGYVALILDADKIDIRGLAISGWKPMGISRTITKSKGNLVYTIDDKPAVDMYLQYLGRQGSAYDQSSDFMIELSMHYPFIVERPEGGTFLHTPLSIDADQNALLMEVPMPEGMKFWFSVPPDFDIVDEVLEEGKKISKGDTADALLVFSCAGRVNVLGPLVQSENEGLHELWKAPMAGFFTYGEFGRDQNNRNEFHSGACCWVALKEK
jgi:hypothetical protein